ncbi:unnamed protein product [Discosporangium mesarthrocarpum]
MRKVRKYPGKLQGRYSSAPFEATGEKECRRWAVLTSIFKPSYAILQLASAPEWCVVVVGDKKGPRRYNVEGVVYLTPDMQEKLPYSIISILPWNHFGRKNVGFMYAIHHGAEVIYDVDDDNTFIDKSKGVPYALSPSDWPPITTFMAGEGEIHVHNPYPCYGGPMNVWPRGFPLNEVTNPEAVVCNPVNATNGLKVGVIQSMANHDPDVDAIYRLTHPPGGLPFDFSAEPRLTVVPKGLFTPYNAQATLHFDPAFWGMLLPITVHGRVSDIWRSYFTQYLLPGVGHQVAFSSPWVEQFRNPHHILGDFSAEGELYERSGEIVSFLAQLDPAELGQSMEERVVSLAALMYEYGIVEKEDVLLMQAWVADLQGVGYEFPPLVAGDEKEAAGAIPLVVAGDGDDAESALEHKLLVIVVPSVRPERRAAIRETWLTWGDDRMVLRFFLEEPDEVLDGKEQTLSLVEEAEEHGDIVFVNIERGMNFGVKLVKALEWSLAHYTFDFFLRLDDDYFLCLSRLLADLEKAKATLGGPLPWLYSGSLWCEKDYSRFDEAYLLASGTLVKAVMANMEGRMCGIHGDVTFAWWLTKDDHAGIEVDKVRWLYDHRLDFRGKHWEAGTFEPRVCQVRLGMHHTTPEAMIRQWGVSKDLPFTDNGAEPFNLVRTAQEECPKAKIGVQDYKFKQRDKAQLCSEFKAVDNSIHCGLLGC